ncbi:MAG TPA: DUF6263 family protein [Chitinophagaceae bacterium]|nr:DUF6263 family protein [Chitinophagaceae bacterium]
MTKGIFLSLVLMAIATGAAYAQKIAITKGQKLETVTTTKTTMEVMGQNMDNESTATSNVEVKDVNAAGYLFTNTIKRMTMKGSTMGQDMSFDSDKKEDMDGQVGQALKGQIGSSQEIQVDKQGKVAGIKENDDKKTAGMTDMMSMTGDISKGQPYPILIQLPAVSVKSGDTWTDSSGTAATFKSTITYTLKGITADGAIVSFTGTVAKSGPIEQNGVEIQMDITGTTKGEAVYETGSGLIKNSASSTEIKGTLGIMGQNAPISGTIIATITAKKI